MPNFEGITTKLFENIMGNCKRWIYRRIFLLLGSFENGQIRLYLEQWTIQLFSKVLIVQCLIGTD